MSVKITNKGTELPLLNLKGKPYLQVAHRFVWFREEHPIGRIVCSLISITDTSAIARAEVYVMGQNPDGTPFETMVSSAHKKETEENFKDFIEKAETGAAGRALAMAGYGTQFEPELDEGDRLADSPILPGRKVNDRETTVERGAVAAKPTGSKGSGTDAGQVSRPQPVKAVTPVQAEVSKPTSRKTILDQITAASRVIIDSKRDTQDNVVKLLTAFGVKTKDELSDDQAKKLLEQLEAKLK